jgi:dUTPase
MSKQTNKRKRGGITDSQFLFKRLREDVPIPQEQERYEYNIVSLENIILKHGDTKTISTGLTFQIPQGYYGFLEVPRTTSLKDLTIINCFFNELHKDELVIYLNNRSAIDEIQINKGDLVARLFFITIATAPLIEVNVLPREVDLVPVKSTRKRRTKQVVPNRLSE